MARFLRPGERLPVTRLRWVWRLYPAIAVANAGLLVDDLRDVDDGLSLGGRIVVIACATTAAILYRRDVHRRAAEK